MGNSLGPEDLARCWLALQYTFLRGAATTLVVKRPQGQIAVTVEEKKALFQEIIFPPPPNLGSSWPIPPGKAHEQITKTRMKKALFNHAVQKISEVDRINFQTL